MFLLLILATGSNGTVSATLAVYVTVEVNVIFNQYQNRNWSVTVFLGGYAMFHTQYETMHAMYGNELIPNMLMAPQFSY